MPVSRARYERERTDLLAEVNRLRTERDDARKERDAFKAAAKTSAEHFVQADAANEELVAAEQRREALAIVKGKHLIEGGRTEASRPRIDCLRCRQLAHRVAELQTSHEADTRELHDLRQGVTA